MSGTHLERAQNCCKYVELYGLLANSLGLLDALGKVVQHLQPVKDTEEDKNKKPTSSPW